MAFTASGGIRTSTMGSGMVGSVKPLSLVRQLVEFLQLSIPLLSPEWHNIWMCLLLAKMEVFTALGGMCQVAGQIPSASATISAYQSRPEYQSPQSPECRSIWTCLPLAQMEVSTAPGGIRTSTTGSGIPGSALTLAL